MLTTRHADGAPNWVDLGTPDTDGAASFYGALFGWRFQPGGPETGGYGFFRLDGNIAAGGMQLTPEQGRPSWTVYFKTADAQAAVEAAEQAHGSVLLQPVDVLDQGRTAVLADRAGVPFGLWQPARSQGLDVVRQPGALCWIELYTADEAAAAAFYHAVLGMETHGVTFPGGTYTTVSPPGTGADAGFGGIVPLADAPAEGPAHWLPYFEVADTDAVAARARELGGTVRMPPTDLPDVGRVARLTDPYGARFAVLRIAPRED
ncbi:VOC family protein [Streptomyces sp. NPDC051041]|uniref:VOC family protein n=1 Tax=Streptomyces sp. NPDC051041 TaxID=3365640 RepID=UPI0037B12CE2